MVLALISALSQLGNIAGSYVWNLKANGYRGSYGIVTAMIGTAMLGCLTIRIVLQRLNKQLKAGEKAWETRQDVTDKTLRIEHLDNLADPAALRKGFRYLV